MTYPKSNRYDKKFLQKNMMGPNCIKMLEDMTGYLKIEKDMRILDLGCGKGLTSIFMAKEYGVKVFATDLWISATENYHTFRSLNLEQQIIPIHADAHEMPFADGYFDGVISVDAYHYFGRDAQFMSTRLAPLIRQGGMLALALPGLKKEFSDSIPNEMLFSWTPEEIETLHSCHWWKEIFSRSPEIKINNIYEMTCFDECWDDWFDCDNEDNEFNEYVEKDRKAMEAGAGNYMNLIGVILTRK